jgi:hypothetical protein
MAHTSQSRPDVGLGFQAKVLDTLEAVPSSPGSGLVRSLGLEVWRFGGYFRLLNMMHAPTTPPLKMNCLDTSEPRSHDYGASPSAPSC